ncbi:hypothetical protein KFU41_15085 [Escherichia coli]|uniref:hypothetical protein n=1 Tax=Escherichia coli TaxID=562 RepID=UPI002093A38F|nr:hypothetical protein [Escherichia coli]MCO6575876.1 hypothetical protein [Escherichia coli]MCO6581031.1 hypothetical protein [Escherichia coli]MCO6586524.1 hypothetical protein [Escherichia coli]MDN9022651.1 hypothetical protein [Escherichia coli]
MTKFTKERLEEIAELARKATYKPCSMHMTNLLVVCDSEVIEEMARQLLASMEQEPVACIDRANLDYLESGADADVWPASGAGSDDVLLYAAPQLPQPAVLSVSEGVLKSLLPDVEKSEFWFEHNGKIFFEGVRFNNAVFEACRAAMLQAGNHTEQHLDMVDHFVDASEKGKDGTLINEGNIPATQIKPVADLYGITSPTGSETTFTFDAGEASSFAKGGWSVQEYVELERYQEAITGK